MAGAKIEQARNGAIDFAHSAINRSYATALAVFADRAAMVCDPTADADRFAKKVARVGGEVVVCDRLQNVVGSDVIQGKIARGFAPEVDAREQ
jgi:hypothetical protein